MDDIGWDRYSPLGKVVEWNTMTHMGRQFGLLNQLIGLASCLFIVMTVVTGVVMWWKRRPAGSGVAAPKHLAGRRIPWGFWPAIVGLSILFPMVGGQPDCRSGRGYGLAKAAHCLTCRKAVDAVPA